MRTDKPGGLSVSLLAGALVAGLVTCAILMIFLFAPTEQSMGDTQRIVYVHVSVAWLGLLGFITF